MHKILLAVIVMAVASPALAAPDEGQQKGRQRDPERMKNILEEFDADGDGKLSQQERQAARAGREAKRGKRPEGARGPAGRGGPMGDPAAMFKRADTDGNGQLSQQEFTAMIEKMRSARGQRGQRGARGRSPKERGQGGSEGRRRRPPVDELQ